MSAQLRVTEAYVARLIEQLTPRDLALVHSLDRLRVATPRQLQRLHFTAGSAHASARQAQRRLRELRALGVLEVLEHRVGGFSGGSAQPVYVLDVAGQHLASACGPAGGRRLRRPWSPGRPFLAHALAVSELFVRLTEAERSGSGELLAFEAEPGCWRRFTGAGGATVTLKPDAFVRFAACDYEYAGFVEVDRATAATTTVRRKLDVYRRYWQAGREQERLGMFPRVVVLVPTEARKAALVKAAAGLPADAWPIFRIALYDAAIPILTGETA